MTAAYVPMDIDQGEDFTSLVTYTDQFDRPYKVRAPCRLDIKDSTGATILSLATPEDELPDGEIPQIGVSGDVGAVQLHIEDDVTAAMMPGTYVYDLFVTVSDGGDYAGNQRQRIIQGPCTVYRRVTEL